MVSRKPSDRRYAYLDTNILSHWALYRTASDEQLATALPRVRASLDLLKLIKKHAFVDLEFETTDFAYSELFQVMRDNIIANKMLRDGQSLVYFFNLRQQYELTKDEIRDLQGNIDLFYKLLEEIKVKSYTIRLDTEMIEALVEDYGMATPDAIHIAWGSDCNYFVTCDRDLIRIHKLGMARVLSPSTLCTLKWLRWKSQKSDRAINEPPIHVKDVVTAEVIPKGTKRD
ncbi:MAG: hypothetical protein ABSD99_04060 [Candidatus Bathyarchaeia archaeon]